MRKLNILMLFFMWTFLMPLFAQASGGLQFSEIMYDPSGSNTGRQWIEIYNADTQGADISEWTLLQGGTNHKISTTTPVSVEIISAGGYAVIASDALKFQTDWPHYSGLLLHSAFTLKNTGEMVSLQDKGVQSDQYTIDPNLGAAGDGNSLQKMGNTWISGAPSPGVPNGASGATTGSANNPAGPSGQSTSSDSQSSSRADQTGSQADNQVESSISGSVVAVTSGNDQYPAAAQIFCNITSGTSYIAGVQGKFSALAWGLLKQSIPNASYSWNFGDGGIGSQQNMFHTYEEPGVYTVAVSVGSDKYSALCRLDVTVSSVQVVISNVQSGVGGFVELENQSAEDIDVSGFAVRSADSDQGQTFYFPQESFLAAHGSVRFSFNTIGFQAGIGTQLLYPNGVLLTTYTGAIDSIPDNDQQQASVSSSATIQAINQTTKATTKSTAKKKSSKTASVSNANVSNENISTDQPQEDDISSDNPATSSTDDFSSDEIGNDSDMSGLFSWQMITGGVVLLILVLAAAAGLFLYWKKYKDWKESDF